jgi:hypothetical protein
MRRIGVFARLIHRFLSGPESMVDMGMHRIGRPTAINAYECSL